MVTTLKAGVANVCYVQQRSLHTFLLGKPDGIGKAEVVFIQRGENRGSRGRGFN